MKHVFIAIPAYTGLIHLGTMRSIVTDMLKLADRGDKVTIFDECGNAMIADCRALIVSKFLESDATDLIFVDSDVAWEAGAILKLVDNEKDFIAGAYPQRKDPINFCIRWINKPELQADSDGLLEVEGVPAGFMKLTRKMLEEMITKYPDTEFYCEPAKDNKAWGLFDSFWLDSRVKLGEDYSFCRRWTEMGGKIWIDPELKLGHVGYKTFVGCIGEWLKGDRK